MKIVPVLLLLICASSQGMDLYKCKLPNGTTLYSGQKCVDGSTNTVSISTAKPDQSAVADAKERAAIEHDRRSDVQAAKQKVLDDQKAQERAEWRAAHPQPQIVYRDVHVPVYQRRNY